MNNLTNKQRAQVIAALVEGNSIRSMVRMTGVSKNTVTKLLGDVGEVCAAYQDKLSRTYPASVFRLTKFGRSATQKTRTCQSDSRVSLVMVMFILGRQFALTQS